MLHSLHVCILRRCPFRHSEDQVVQQSSVEEPRVRAHVQDPQVWRHKEARQVSWPLLNDVKWRFHNFMVNSCKLDELEWFRVRFACAAFPWQKLSAEHLQDGRFAMAMQAHQRDEPQLLGVQRLALSSTLTLMYVQLPAELQGNLRSQSNVSDSS